MKKEMLKDWKEILKVSFIVSITMIILNFLFAEFISFYFEMFTSTSYINIENPALFEYFSSEISGAIFQIENIIISMIFFISSLLLTTILLNRKLKKNDWGILFGAILVFIFYSIAGLIYYFL